MAMLKKNKTLQENINSTSHYRVQTENQESSQFKFNFNKVDSKFGCKTETSVLENENELINEDNSFESQEEIQKKYDQIDKKEGISLNDDWFEKFEDLDENLDEEFNESNDENQNDFDNLFYSNNEMDLGQLAHILEIIKEENTLLKEKEQNIKEDFEKLKYDYARIAKEKRLFENKLNRN